VTEHSHRLRLAGRDLGEHRHVCALFDGPAAASDVITPFAVEGLEQDERIVYIAGAREPFLGRLGATRDLAAPLGSGQLEVLTWADSYISDDRFSSMRVLEVIRSSLATGPTLGFDRTRLIGEMEWARDDLAGIDELVAYELALDGLLRERPDTIICSYDVGRHSGARIAAVVSAHQAVFSGGILRRGDGFAPGSTPRDRILWAASSLFAARGVRASGVDSLIAAAHVAKATFYRHFASKDLLIVAWLQDPRTRWLERVRAEAEGAARSPDDIVPCFFEALAQWLEADSFRGCPYLNTSVEIPGPAHPAWPVIGAYLDDVHGYLESVLASSGYRAAPQLADQLQALAAGATSLAVARRTSAFAIAARDVAVDLLRGAERRARTTQPSRAGA
jgi:AcrR family transcriptional regulator